jgi:SNF2 family DNA or RNA helicase
MILAHATGLGKSLTALMAALEKRNKMLPHCRPILVVTLPSCVYQWLDEIRTHFKKVSPYPTGHGIEFRLTTTRRAALKR